MATYVNRSTILHRAQQMRRSLTPSEAKLWSLLKNKQLDGLKFRRQHPFGPYILDFYCAELRIAVEVDGSAHDDEAQAAHDERRDAYLARENVRVLHVRASALQDRSAEVMAWIGSRCREGTLPSGASRLSPLRGE